MEALKRFIHQMEKDAIEERRIAKEYRRKNHRFDHRVNSEKDNRLFQELKTNQTVIQQIQNHVIRKQVDEIKDKSVPDIAGTMGYP